MRMQIVILILVLIGVSGGKAQAQFDDPLPWPWGSECPFPWSQLTGLWQITNTEAGGYFYFHLEGHFDPGERPLLRIWRYTSEGLLQSYGRTHVDWNEKVVQITLGPARDSVISYQMILRSYPNHSIRDGRRGNCYSVGGQVMVFTLRKIVDGKSVDLHYRLNRIRFSP